MSGYTTPVDGDPESDSTSEAVCPIPIHPLGDRQLHSRRSTRRATDVGRKVPTSRPVSLGEYGSVAG